MPEPRLISPMLDGFVVGAPISDHHGVRCCPAMTKDTNQRYLLKIIRVPASQVQLDALLLTGAYPDEASALSYFKEMSQDICKEAQVLSALSAKEGFFPYEKTQVVEMDDGIGYEVYLLSPYKRTLERFFRKETITHLNAVNLGLDLCAALTVCRDAGYLYADLKPENIYVTQEGRFRIGDLGFLPLNGLKYASLPDKYRSAYTAPEVEDAYSTVNTTIDIYAAGLILYQAYNGGVLPEELTGGAPLPAPIFADYEMAEIILKACDADPSLRWQDPMQMGQALVSYMQRNGANDTPIVPASVTMAAPPASPFAVTPEEAAGEAASDAEVDAIIEQIRMDAFAETEDAPAQEAEAAPEDAEAAPEEAEEPAADAPAEEAAEEAAEDAAPEQQTDEVETLSFLASLSSDDTAPDQRTAEEATYDEVSEEVEDILSQADALIAHPLPEPVVAPEPVDVPIPPLPAEETEAAEPLEEPAEEAADTESPADADTEAAEEAEAAQEASEEAPASEEEAAADADAEEDDEFEEAPPAGKSKKAIGIILALIVLAGLVFGIYAFYKHYYLQTVTSLTLDGSDTALTVHVTATVDESLLTVVCTDAYGNKLTRAVVNGCAVFESLNPSTLYSVKVEVSGLHKLNGDIADSYSTPMQQSITGLNVSTGEAPGSAVVSFNAPNAAANDTWTLLIRKVGTEEVFSHSFTGTVTTVEGLELGGQYLFELTGSTAVSGETQIVYSAVAPLIAENVRLEGTGNGEITVLWDTPDDATVASWLVSCSSSESDSTLTTVTENKATFTGLDSSLTYTITVTAEGMQAKATCYITAQPVAISNAVAEPMGTDQIRVRWDCAQSGSWFVLFQVEGSDKQEIVRTNTTEAVLSGIVPGVHYTVDIRQENNTVLCGVLDYTAPQANAFNGYALGYIVRDTPMEFSMCVRPDGADWTHDKVKTYTTQFSAGQSAAFVIHIPSQYNTPNDVINRMFVIYDEEGNLVSYESTKEVWRSMWYKRYCELDVPSLPADPGSYRLDIYFNGMLAHSQNFTVTA